MDNNNQRFVRFIGIHESAIPILPAVRTVNVNAFGAVTNSGSLEPVECPFYHESLLYFFYGKPAYKINRRVDAATRILGDAAVCFVFDLASMPVLRRSFALDTGAFFGKRYDEFLPNGIVMEDFRLPDGCEWFAKLVTAFFGNNRNYFVGQPKNDVKLPALDRTSEVYRSMMQTPVSVNFDDRACTCELQFNTSISIEKSRLLTIVMPDQLSEDPEVRKILESWNVKPLPYQMRRSTPGGRTEVIIERLGDYYKANGLI